MRSKLEAHRGDAPGREALPMDYQALVRRGAVAVTGQGVRAYSVKWPLTVNPRRR